MEINNTHDRMTLQNIARRVMIENGMLADFSPEVLNQLAQIKTPARESDRSIRDLRDMLWASIDNDDSLDLDQLTVACPAENNCVKILVAIADVDALVKKGSALDVQAQHNTTSVYTPAEVFAMLPEQLSTDLTSLKQDADRLSIIVEMTICEDGSIRSSDVYRALVRNKAKLAYNSVAAWLEDREPIPQPIAAIKGLDDNLRLQDKVAQNLKKYRQTHGALSFETTEAKPIFDGSSISTLKVEQKNRATELISDLMIAANGITARFLDAKHFPSLRRVVRTPNRWNRIVEIAAEHNYNLPDTPSSQTLEQFLVKEKADDPVQFPDLSISIIKLLGPGEYVAELPGGEAPGHFGLAVKDYEHSTAPNRRFPDIVTQRLLKAAIEGKAVPYTLDELSFLATHCTQEEDVAKKIERQVNKSAAALLLRSKIGAHFNAIVTGAAEKGTWVRLLEMPVEGKLVQGFAGLDVGHRVKVQLLSVDVQRGFIDFSRIV